jgi:prephenate dehydrogenase
MNPPKIVGTLCVIGVGLIGGSLALAARRRGFANRVVGYDTDAKNLATALALGLIDVAGANIADAAAMADIVVIAAPVGAMPAIFRALQPVWCEACIYTDTGSTKADVIAAAEAVFGQLPANFVPGHPVAGAECSGADAAREDLFDGKRVILTPLSFTQTAGLRRVEHLWEAVGAHLSVMPFDQHDEVLAATSHLPHVLAFVLTEMLGRKDEQQQIFDYAAGGFRDFTRIASSDSAMWLDICMANRTQIVPLIEEYREALDHAAKLMSTGKREELRILFDGARAARQRFLDQLEK